MAKLYPPTIEGTIPAFYGDSMTIPYSMNRTVNKNEIAGFSLKIKTVQNNLHLGTLNTNIFTEHEAKFKLSEDWFKGNSPKINMGQYYKVQMAYINNEGIIGYYSTVGVIKYTSEPIVEIIGLTTENRNAHTYDYLGRYYQDIDWTEKVYSYNFKMTDLDGNVIADSGEVLHNSTLDNEKNESHDSFVVTQELPNNASYHIQYTITTINGMKVSSPKYRIAQKQSVSPELKANLLADLNFENGYITLSMEGVIENGYEKLASGAFMLSRCKETEPGN